MCLQFFKREVIYKSKDKYIFPRNFPNSLNIEVFASADRTLIITKDLFHIVRTRRWIRAWLREQTFNAVNQAFAWNFFYKLLHFSPVRITYRKCRSASIVWYLQPYSCGWKCEKSVKLSFWENDTSKDDFNIKIDMEMLKFSNIR